MFFQTVSHLTCCCWLQTLSQPANCLPLVFVSVTTDSCSVLWAMLIIGSHCWEFQLFVRSGGSQSWTNGFTIFNLVVLQGSRRWKHTTLPLNYISGLLNNAVAVMLLKLWYIKCKFLSWTDSDFDPVGPRRDPGYLYFKQIVW